MNRLSKLISSIILNFLLVFTFNAQEIEGQSTFGKTVAYSKFGFLHGINFNYLHKDKIVLNYELGINLKTTYLQQRFRPVNSLSLGYNLLNNERMFTFSPLILFSLDTYHFSGDNRMNYMSINLGYQLLIGRKKWKVLHSSSIGQGHEFHWEQVVTRYLSYQSNIGVVYGF